MAAKASLITITNDFRAGNFSETYIMPVVVNEIFSFSYTLLWDPVERLSPPQGSQYTFYSESTSTELDFGNYESIDQHVVSDFAEGRYSLSASGLFNTSGKNYIDLAIMLQSTDIFYYFSSTSSSSTDFTDVLTCLRNIIFGCTETTTSTSTTEIYAEKNLELQSTFRYEFEVAAAEVPEPGTLALLGLGLFGLGAARRRQKA